MSAKLRVRHAPYLEARLADEIVARELIPVQQGQLYPERLLVPPDVEEKLLVPDGVERVANDTGTKDLLAEGHDDEGVHVPASARHVLELRQVLCAVDLEHDDADDIIMGVQVELALLLDTGP